MIPRYYFIRVLYPACLLLALASPLSVHAVQQTEESAGGSPPAAESQATRDADSSTPAAPSAPIALDAETSVSVDAVASDEAIEDRLRRILTASDWFDSTSVEVDEGIVIIGGMTADTARRDWAGSVARRTQDVVAVVNNIEVTDDIDIAQSAAVVASSLETLWRDFLKRVPLMCAAIGILMITWLAATVAVRIVTSATKRSKLRGGLRDLARQLTTCCVWLMGIMIAAVVMFPGMTPAKLLTVLGLSSVAIGFAFKDIFENFFAGVLILWRFPFERHDFIECGDVCGKVEDVTVRMTSIRQVDGQLVVLPNAMLFKQAVHVMTSQRSRRVEVACGVAYGTDLVTARDVLQKALADCETIDRARPMEVLVREFADSSINFDLVWWTGSKPMDERRSRNEVVTAVKHHLDEAGIEIPFPQRSLLIQQPLKVDVGDSTDDVSTGQKAS